MASLITIVLLFSVFMLGIQAKHYRFRNDWGAEIRRAESFDEINEGFKPKYTNILRGKDHMMIDPSKVTQLSWEPRAFLYKGFLSHEECDHIVRLAEQRVERSQVASNEDGSSELSQVRTSFGTFLSKSEDAVIRRIEERIAAWTFLPIENGEGLQVLRYNLGQKYDAHYDYFHDKNNLKLGGHRMATVLMYLSDVKKGGETVFPNAGDSRVKDSSWTECGKSGLAVKPVKGDTILFFSLHPDATTDPFSLHTSCPVIEGVKWSAAKWIHVSTLNKPYVDPNNCEDEDPENCQEWAFSGECNKNRTFMVGDEMSPGKCLKSCNACNK